MSREQMLEAALLRAVETLESLQGGCTDSDDGTVEAITVWCPDVVDLARAALSTPAEPRTVEPLTNADVVEGWRTTEALRDDYGWTSCEWFQAGVRFAQRHYGIGLVLAGGEQG